MAEKATIEHSLITMILMSSVCTALPSVALQVYFPASEVVSGLNVRVFIFPTTCILNVSVGLTQVIIG